MQKVNEENRNQIIVLVLLVAVAGFFIFRSFSSVSGDGATPTASAGSESTATIVAFQSVFDDVDVDINQLMENIKDVEFQYSEVQIARDPSLPILKGSVGTPIDPTFPLDGSSLSPDSLVYLAELKVVTGIIHGDDNPMAVIDGEVVSIGYEFRDSPDAKPIIVKSIGIDSVVLSIPSEDVEVIKELIK